MNGRPTVTAEQASVTDSRRVATGADSRNARLAAELEATLEQVRNLPPNPRLDALAEAINGGPITPERRDANVTRAFCEDTAYECATCRHVFVDGDVVHRKRAAQEPDFTSRWSLVSICEGCVRTTWHPSWIENRREPVPCAAGCGVLVSHWYYDAITTCSRRCAEAVTAARKRVEVDARACVVCGESFTPKRSDARYCSNACRQDAYRKRKDGAIL